MVNQKLNILSKKDPVNDRNSKVSIPMPANGNQTSFGIRKYMEKLIPLSIAVGFVLLILLLFGDNLWPAKRVDLVTVFVKQMNQETTELNTSIGRLIDFDTPALFQASGWLEADPYPYRATTLVNGFVNDVFVLEGQSVKKGQIIASLVDEDAELDLRSAEYAVQKSKAELEARKLAVKITEAEIESLNAQIDTANAKQAELDDTAQRMILLSGGAVPEQAIKQALLKQLTQQSVVASLQSNQGQLEAKINKQLQEQTMMGANLRVVELDLVRKQLAFDRTKILAPIDGIVQSLHAAPGQKKMTGSDHPESMTIAVVFDPDSLQARIDVPLEEAGKIRIGQAVLVKTHFLPDITFRGRVTRLLGESDIQRNTLQAKIEILNPDYRLRPEMLCRAEFLSNKTGTGVVGSGADDFIILAPHTTVVSVNEDRGVVYRLTTDRRRIEQVSVTIRTADQQGYYVITEGLRAGDQLVNNPTGSLKNQQRIKVNQK